MELRELATFREVAHLANFGRAAVRLGYAQSTVSAHIAALEEDLGIRLIDRLGRTIALTAAGEALLPYAEQVLELAAQARSAAMAAVANDAALTGTVTVSAPESLLTYRLPKVLSSFRAAQPGVTIDLRPTPIGRFRGPTSRAVASGAIDLAFVLDAALGVPGFCAEILCPEPISVVAPAGHSLGRLNLVGGSDLGAANILLPEAPESGCAYRGQFERQLSRAGVSLDGALEFASIETVKQCVIAGMGIAVLPTVAVQAEVDSGRLVALPWRETFDVSTQMVWNERRWISPAQAAFMTVARAVIREA